MNEIEAMMYELEAELDNDDHELELDHDDDGLLYEATQHETDCYRVPLDAAVRLMGNGYILEDDSI